MSRSAHPLAKLAIEIGPLSAFFIANGRYGIFVGTAAFMVATVFSFAGAYWFERKIPVMPAVTAVFVLVFGGLTLVLHDDLFIKIKPTIINLLFAAILGGGMMMGRPLLRLVLGGVLPKMTEAGWRSLTWRWVWFFILLAVINEVLWRNFSTDFWVQAKLFAVAPLTILFSFAQVPLIRRHLSEPLEP